MAFEEYVRDEIVADCAEGFLTRREALRRLILPGIGATTAAALLAGCGGAGHAFFNEAKPDRHNATAAADAYTSMARMVPAVPVMSRR